MPQNPLPNVTIIGGGMITNDLILPTVYHLQRTGQIGSIDIVGQSVPTLHNLANERSIMEAFPGQAFTPHPALSEPDDAKYPDLYKEILASLPPRQVVVIALPDQMHHEVVLEALRHNQHVACVKPLVLKYEHAVEIEREAYERGLFVGIEYHKRFDRRSLLARREYRLGYFGEFAMGDAKLIEPYYYRSSNFQNWFTADQTDPFVYVGCHYVDLVYFITGLRPVAVSVQGIKGRFPNGNEGYMWAHGRVTWENGAILNVMNGLGYPDQGAGSNDQGLMMFCEGDGKTGMIRHNDQFRGIEYSYLEGRGCAGSHFNYINPDFFRLVAWEGEGYKPIGYGPDSVSALILAASRIESETAKLFGAGALNARRRMLKDIDDKGLIATPANSSINELLIEAARMSILADGKTVRITYDKNPRVAI